MRKHADACAEIRTAGGIDSDVHAAAIAAWQKCLALGETNGYRNAQASLLAPTGTIGLMMDCDTTGVEPDLALVKFKKLVGGGSMQIVNQTVPRALKNLGYQSEQVEAITEYIAEHGHVVDAPGLRPEHYEVFDCAMGERAISPMGHVRMMAAVQPGLSGAIHKCVDRGDAGRLVRRTDPNRQPAPRTKHEDSFREERLVISSLNGDRKTDAFYYGGNATSPACHAFAPVTRSQEPLPHRLLVARRRWPCSGRRWPRSQEGDAVALQYGAELWSATAGKPARHQAFRAPYGNQKSVTLPAEMYDRPRIPARARTHREGHTTRQQLDHHHH